MELYFGSGNSPFRTDPSLTKSLKLCSFIPSEEIFAIIFFFVTLEIAYTELLKSNTASSAEALGYFAAGETET